MAITSDKIKTFLGEMFNIEKTKYKRKEGDHTFFFSEKIMFEKLNAKADEDIKNIRILASAYISSHNKRGHRIETDIDKFWLGKAKALRAKGELEQIATKSIKVK